MRPVTKPEWNGSCYRVYQWQPHEADAMPVSAPDGVIEVTMLDPVIHHLHHAPQAARWISQLVQLDPELAAALPLLAARLMDAGGGEEDERDDEEGQEPLAI